MGFPLGGKYFRMVGSVLVFNHDCDEMLFSCDYLLFVTCNMFFKGSGDE